MTRKAEVKRNQQLPFLGSLPIIGYLFGGENTTAQQTMLVIAVKPVRIDNFTNYNATDPELERYEHLHAALHAAVQAVLEVTDGEIVLLE